MAIQPMYGEYKDTRRIGPGHYIGAETLTASCIIPEPDKLDKNFISASPRLPRERAPMNVGSNTATVALDKAKWDQKATGTNRYHAAKSTRVWLRLLCCCCCCCCCCCGSPADTSPADASLAERPHLLKPLWCWILCTAYTRARSTGRWVRTSRDRRPARTDLRGAPSPLFGALTGAPLESTVHTLASTLP